MRRTCIWCHKYQDVSKFVETYTFRVFYKDYIMKFSNPKIAEGYGKQGTANYTCNDCCLHSEKLFNTISNQLGETEEKKCISCTTIKKWNDFRHPEKDKLPKSAQFLKDWCLACRAKWSREYFLRRKYGIDTDIYNEMLFKQKGVCRICGSKEKKGKKLAVDHCHSNNTIRGLLCHNCNIGLGLFKDNQFLLMKAIDYLNGHSLENILDYSYEESEKKFKEGQLQRKLYRDTHPEKNNLNDLDF